MIFHECEYVEKILVHITRPSSYSNVHILVLKFSVSRATKKSYLSESFLIVIINYYFCGK